MNAKANPEHPSIIPETENTSKKIYLRSENTFVEVTDDVYYAYYRPIWKLQKNAQRKGKCNCPQKFRWKCDAECYDCPYHINPDEVSDTALVQDIDDLSLSALFLSEEPDPEKTVIFHELLSAFNKELEKMNPKKRQIFLYYLSGMTESEIGTLLNISQVAVNKNKKRILEQLRNNLQDYLN